MTVLRKRKISPANFLIVFAAASFVVHIWLFYIILNQLPSWILRMSAFDVAGMISYSLAFALFESLLIAGGLALLALFLPRGMILHLMSFPLPKNRKRRFMSFYLPLGLHRMNYRLKAMKVKKFPVICRQHCYNPHQKR